MFCGVFSFVVVFFGSFVSSVLVVSGSFIMDSFDGLVIVVIGKKDIWSINIYRVKNGKSINIRRLTRILMSEDFSRFSFSFLI